ncbi:MAG: hypothetical protein ABFR89_02435 [Actinomycetota bacterium]
MNNLYTIDLDSPKPTPGSYLANDAELVNYLKGRGVLRQAEVVRVVTVEELGNGGAWNIVWAPAGDGEPMGPPNGVFLLVKEGDDGPT